MRMALVEWCPGWPLIRVSLEVKGISYLSNETRLKNRIPNAKSHRKIKGDLMTFENELREIILSIIRYGTMIEGKRIETPEEGIKAIKLLISKYAPKEQIPEVVLAKRKITYAEVYGWNAYRTELFKELGIK